MKENKKVNKLLKKEISEIKVTTEIDGTKTTKTYNKKELTGQDLFIFMEMADKIDIDAMKINLSAGKVEMQTREEFAIANDLKGKSKIDEEYNKHISTQQISLAGLGIMTYILKKGHLIKDEINTLISKVWTMETSTVLKLSTDNYLSAAAGAFQLKSVINSIKSFFQ